ncbi:MAG: DUF541 domain-containing protein [Alphaproteobacteria bacterium]|nr:DUF541 domain-containing protein [Alphaproteobacteria bacterium]
MKYKSVLDNANFYLLFSVLAIIACVGFLYKIQDGVLISPRCIESSAEIEREIEADQCVWTLVFDKVGNNQSELNRELKKSKDKVIEFFKEKDIDEDDMEFQLFVREEGRSRKTDAPALYRMGYRLIIKSNDLTSVLKIKNDLSDLYKQNVIFSSNNLKFRCSLSEKIKQEMALEVAKKAMNRARDMAKALDTEILKVWRVYEPSFRISSPNMDTNYGIRGVSVDSNIQDDDAVEARIPKRKVKAYIKLDAEMK